VTLASECDKSGPNRQEKTVVRTGVGIIILAVAVVLSGCANDGLRDLGSESIGPEEFMVLPVKPLTAPSDYTVLPPPTPGGSNLIDPTPKAEGVTALGGSAAALQAQVVPASDGALVAQASRYGVPSNVRQSLAEEDAEFRKRQARLSNFRLFPVDRYEQAYRRQAIDPFAETSRFRNSGFATPTAPPAGE
jgi:hypothetical protein